MRSLSRPLVAAVLALALMAVAAVPASASAAPERGHHDSTNKDPRSPHVVVNKHHALNPRSYVPSGLVTPKVHYANSAHLLRSVPASHLEDMFRAYNKATGKSMTIQSAYRSYATQKVIYNRYVSQHGQAWADRRSARPGFSEHQTGLALDIAAWHGSCTLGSCFANTSQGKWLAKNAWQYGFILRYPKGYESTTGYTFEPWHYRYVGVDVATDMHEHGDKTLEAYFAYGKAPTY